LECRQWGREIAFQGVVALSYNTHSNFEQRINRASSEKEAKWNYAFWLRDKIAEVPRVPEYGLEPDDDEMKLRDSWGESIGLLPDDRDETGRPTYEEQGLYAAIARALTPIVQQLHDDGSTVNSTGRTVPVIIHSLEYDPIGVTETNKANPADILVGFNAWINSIRTT